MDESVAASLRAILSHTEDPEKTRREITEQATRSWRRYDLPHVLVSAANSVDADMWKGHVIDFQTGTVTDRFKTPLNPRYEPDQYRAETRPHEVCVLAQITFWIGRPICLNWTDLVLTRWTELWLDTEPLVPHTRLAVLVDLLVKFVLYDSVFEHIRVEVDQMLSVPSSGVPSLETLCVSARRHQPDRARVAAAWIRTNAADRLKSARDEYEACKESIKKLNGYLRHAQSDGDDATVTGIEQEQSRFEIESCRLLRLIRTLEAEAGETTRPRFYI